VKISAVQLRKIIRERLKKSLGGSYPDDRYVVATDKNMFLNTDTSHGGWPEGPSRSAYDKTPVNKQISNYLKSMGILSEDDED
tara:strand:- start:194 stop:442 length:249 start_codon:yes stop_codon:yes gene_type:complete